MSSINATPGSSNQFSALIKSGDSNANLALQVNGVTVIQIDSNQVANCTSTGAVLLPRGTTEQRPSSPTNGMLRYNTSYANIETYVNGIWTNVTPILTPVISVSPVASGNAVVGQTLSVTTGTWSNTPTGYYYQWLANSVAISSNATSNTFVLTSTQTGANVSCNVTAYNAYGNSTTTVTSNSIGPIANSYSISYLIVAGGGGGGSRAGAGGGGAGGYLANTTTLTPSTVYTITVGGGGAGGLDSVNPYSGTQGSNSSIAGLAVAIGGGYGVLNGTPGNGGSGGGGSRNSATGGTGTSGQGNNGGNSGTGFGGGGGGGAGAAGATSTSTTAGKGGDGLASSITGSSVTYAGGGGGSGGDPTGSGAAGGAGGGGAGANMSGGTGGAGTSGTANTGGGGGGGGYTGSNVQGGAGGSGVVILSIPTSYYSGITTGSPTVTTSGSNTILKYTASGTYTA